jgi:hypothetical protein
MSVKLEGISKEVAKVYQRTDKTTNIFIRITDDPAKIQTRQLTDTSLRLLPPNRPVQYV